MIRSYIRVSTKKQADEGDSLAVQQIDASEWASRHQPNTDIVEYIEPGLSGSTLDRPVLQEMLADLEDGDIVLVWRLDRLSRDMIDRAVLKAEIATAGGKIHAVHQQFDESPEGWMMEGLDGLMSEYEIRKIGLRTKIVLRRKAERGDLVTAPPYGYRTVKREAGGTVEWAIVPEEAEVVGLIDAFYLHGWGGPRIADHLNAQRTPSPSGGRWSPGGVRAIVGRSTYHGEVVYGRQRWEKHQRVGAGDPVISTVDIEPIRTTDTWIRLEGERRKRNSHPGRPRRRSPFGSVLQCGVCGSGMQVEVSKRIYYSYICSASKKDGSCIRNSISERRLVGLIRSQVDAHGHADMVANATDPDSDRVEKDLAALELRRQRLITAFESGVMTLDDVAPRLERFSQRRDELESALKAEPASVNVPIAKVMLVNDIDDRETLIGWVDDVVDRLVWTKGTGSLEIRLKAPSES